MLVDLHLRKSLISFLFLISFSSFSFSQNVKTYIPPKCKALKPYIVSESALYTPWIPTVGYYGSLSEHESCISLTHSRCCSPTSELRSSRELGVGISMITKAYHPDGSIRFDTLSDLKRTYRSALSELSWENIKNRPDLQIRAMVLLVMENWNRFPNAKIPIERLRFTDSSYNGGAGAVIKARTACGLAKGCDPNYWFNNTEKYLIKSKKPIYSGRSAYDIALHHVKDTTVTRLLKYELLYND